MFWQADLDAYPLLLCGPILRRVTLTSVAVFVVLKEHRWVQLRLYDAPTTYDDQPTHVGPILNTVRLGEHFFVGLATLDLTASPLGQGTTHAYNVFFHDQADGSGPEVSLAQHDFHLLTIGNPHRIGFAPNGLPSFVVPPGDLAELRIAQGSCRKPHGMGIDMLASLDTRVANGNAPHAQRPHLLLLGGDQIYADDVSPPLLRMVHDAARVLLVWNEVLEGTGPVAGIVPEVAQLDQTLADLFDDLEQATGAFAANVAKPVLIDTLNQLAGALDLASSEATFSDNVVKNELKKLKLRAALAVFRELVEDAIEEANLPNTTPQAVRDRLAVLVGETNEWVKRYKALFLPLATNRDWGRVALANEPADLPDLSGIASKLGAIADSTSTDVGGLLDEFVAAFEGDFDSADTRALAESAKAIAANLQQNLGEIDVDEIKALAAQYKAHYFPGERAPYRPSRISAPQRGLELKQHAGLTSDAMDAHLMFFGEFLLMYVFAWSDAVWPQVRLGNQRSFVLPPYFESVPNYGLTGPMGPAGLEEAEETLIEFAEGLQKVRRVLANVPTLMMFDDHEVTDDWNLNEDWLRNVNTKPAGVQVLRNALIAYAIFQDWGNQPNDYLDVGSGPNRPIGRRLLDAVTYVPADPNAPDDADYDVDTASAGFTPPKLKPPGLFRDTNPANPNSTMANVNRLLGVGPAQMSELAGLTIDSVFTTNPADVAYKTVPDAGRKQWDWHYDIAADTSGPSSPTKRNVRIISLDTRTRRAFPDTAWSVKVGLTVDGQASIDGKTAGASLVNGAELTRQLDDRFEDGWLHLVISPAPVFGLPLLEDLVQRLLVLKSGPEVADFESWQANPHGFKMLLTSLRSADCVLVSGDVHYAYSNLLSFPETESADGAVVPAKLLLQLCSSSMRNETGMTQVLGAVGRSGRLVDFVVPALDEIAEMVVAGFADLPETLGDLWSDLSNFPTWFDETAPLLNPFNPGAWATYYLKLKDTMLFSLNVPTPQGLLAVGSGVVAYVRDDLFNGSPDGEFERVGFKMNFLKDDRTASPRRNGAAALSGKTEDQIEAVIAPAQPDNDLREKLADQLLAEMSEVVGYNNVGLITFSGPGTAGDDVQHELLWHPHGSNNEPFEPFHDQVLASTRHGEFPILASLPLRIAEAAQAEYARWNPPSGRILESEDLGIAILEDYKATLLNYDARLQTLTGRSMTTFEIPAHAWSAMFVSYVMHRAQVGHHWLYSQLHIDYARAAFINHADGNDNPFRLYQKAEFDAVVRVGDVVGGQSRGRPHNTTPAQWDEGVDDVNIADDLFGGKLVATHFDIVVEVSDESPPRARTIGGNLGPTGRGTSKNQWITLDAEGRLAGGQYGLIRAEVV